ncbi:uncharacterized protein LOC113460640 isoform X2 [Zonotrichia albicollis]|uniref:uncharacterized protein LOC113460640 isoform X2 n=1 Tax=Zonotrichia albicollis TaxID=44394 RepID=UPI003D80D426
MLPKFGGILTKKNPTKPKTQLRSETHTPTTEVQQCPFPAAALRDACPASPRRAAPAAPRPQQAPHGLAPPRTAAGRGGAGRAARQGEHPHRAAQPGPGIRVLLMPLPILRSSKNFPGRARGESGLRPRAAVVQVPGPGRASPAPAPRPRGGRDERSAPHLGRPDRRRSAGPHRRPPGNPHRRPRPRPPEPATAKTFPWFPHFPSLWLWRYECNWPPPACRSPAGIALKELLTCVSLRKNLPQVIFLNSVLTKASTGLLMRQNWPWHMIEHRGSVSSRTRNLTPGSHQEEHKSWVDVPVQVPV